MIWISYASAVCAISAVWLLLRAVTAIRSGRVVWKREAQLLLVYICVIVVARFTFFPFSKVDGQIQPLLFDAALAFPPRINLLPFVY
ncbi:MAG: VanZ family protein, partial [Oscillospiraceae bacterium]|nr:VanZ family protein [Oscillospiraceae bacterium]